MATMNFEKYEPVFTRDGFVVVPQFLIGDDFTDLTSNLERYIREVVPSLPDADAFYEDKSRPETLKQMQHMGNDPFFKAYRQHPRWGALAEALLGETVEAQDD